MLAPAREISQFDDERLVIAVVDVVGPPPSVERVPDLKAALAELDKQIGLKAVKEQAHVLVKLAQINYQRELNCEHPHLVPMNRLFLGNPGTGKTTVAKIYGRILKALGYLSDGSIETKTPSDLIASAAGGTEEKTAAVLESCKGKVLVIDEAYGLHGGMYGAKAIETIISKVHNTPGEDIAVLLLGYEEDMMKMLREANPGMMRRFSPESAFRFEDFTDAQLEELLHLAAAAAGLRWAKRFGLQGGAQPAHPRADQAQLWQRWRGQLADGPSQGGGGQPRRRALDHPVRPRLEEGAAGGTAKTAALLDEVEKDMASLFKVEGAAEALRQPHGAARAAAEGRRARPVDARREDRQLHLRR